MGVSGTTMGASASCDRDRRVAYHEAGHAVARFIEGLTIRRITIEPDEVCGTTCEGHVLPTRLPDHNRIPAFDRDARRRWRRRVLRDLEFTCAGTAAEFLACPELDDDGRGPYFSGVGEGSDYATAKYLALIVAIAEAGVMDGDGRQVEPEETRVMEIFDEAFGRVRARLNRLENWWQVEALAELLIDRRTLLGREAKAVCDRARADCDQILSPPGGEITQRGWRAIEAISQGESRANIISILRGA